MFLLDTNVISELRTGVRGNVSVHRWSNSVSFAEMYLSVASVSEIETGVLLFEKRDPVRSAVIRQWLEGTVIPQFAGRILPVDLRIGLRCAGLHVPRRRPYLDAIIAATALVHNLTVVTRNVRDFADTGVRILNPFEAG